MLIIPQSPARRSRRQKASPAAPPGPPNEITDWSDPFSGPDNTLTVTVQGTVTSIDAGGVGGFEGHESSDGWFAMTGVDLSDPPRVRFIFGRDMTGSDSWRVPDASKWHFANGQPLVGAVSGDFT